MNRTGPTNTHTQTLIAALVQAGVQAPIWKRVAFELARSTRQRREVNLSRINRYTEQNETIIVPGKVLGSGVLEHPVTIAAFSFSVSARTAIEHAKGKTITIAELVKAKPKGQGVRIIG